MGDTSLNEKVLAFAARKLGQRVKRGECWDLPHEALAQAGAQSSTTTGDNDNYVWGTQLPVAQAVAGDILQFRDYVVTTTVVQRVTFKDGSWLEKTRETKQSRGHHSAIVAAAGRGTLQIFEQNVKPKGKVVQRHELVLAGSGPTTVTTSRDEKDAKGQMRPATVVETTTVVVSGFVWAYRPRAAP